MTLHPIAARLLVRWWARRALDDRALEELEQDGARLSSASHVEIAKATASIARVRRFLEYEIKDERAADALAAAFFARLRPSIRPSEESWCITRVDRAAA